MRLLTRLKRPWILTTNHSFTYVYVSDLSCSLNSISFFYIAIVSEQYGTNVIFFKVKNQSLKTVLKFEKLS